jgi:hypothetical protein
VATGWIIHNRFATPVEGIYYWRLLFCEMWRHTVCYQRFGVTFCLHLQTRRWRQQVPSKCWQRSTRLHGVTSKKTVIFIVTAARTSNLEPIIVPIYRKRNRTDISCRVTSQLTIPRKNCIQHCFLNLNDICKQNYSCWIWGSQGSSTL